MADNKKRRFVRVKDRSTKHQYDVHRDALDPERHEVVARAGDSWIARAAKPYVTNRKTSAPKADEGVSPDLSASS